MFWSVTNNRYRTHYRDCFSDPPHTVSRTTNIEIEKGLPPIEVRVLESEKMKGVSL